MRLSDRWPSANRLPPIIVTTASHQRISCHAGTAANAWYITRNSAANAAALTPVAMNAVTGVGAPS